MEDSKKIDPALAARGVEQAELKRQKMEQEIVQLKQEWQGQLEQVRQESERVLKEDEVKEFKTRVAVLVQELEQKNTEIMGVQKEKELIEETVMQVFQKEVDLADQAEEIDLLNARY